MMSQYDYSSGNFAGCSAALLCSVVLTATGDTP
jgi:hypothetical protein